MEHCCPQGQSFGGYAGPDTTPQMVHRLPLRHVALPDPINHGGDEKSGAHGQSLDPQDLRNLSVISLSGYLGMDLLEESGGSGLARWVHVTDFDSP